MKSFIIKKDKSDYIIKIMLIIGFISLVAISNNVKTTNGYENSIYTNISFSFWVILILNIVSGICIVIYSIYTNKKSSIWLIGLVLIMLSYIILLLLPILRGYALYDRHDTTTQLGTAKNLFSIGFIDRYKTIYPAIFIFVSELSYVSNIELITIFRFMPTFFGILFILFMYILYRFILPYKNQSILTVIASFIILPATGIVEFRPNTVGDLILPLAILMYIKGSAELIHKTEYRLLFIIIAFLFPIFHPVITVILILLIATTWLPKRLYESYYRNDNYRIKNINTIYDQNFIISSIVILIVWSFMWWSPTLSLTTFVHNIYTSFSSSGGDTNALEILEHRMSYASEYGYSVLEQFFKSYDEILIYTIFSIISLIIILRETSYPKFDKIFSLYAPIVALTLLGIVLFGFDISFSPYRVITPLLIINTGFIGIVINKGFGTVLRKYFLVIILFILIILTINGILKMYSSHYILVPNNQLTYSEIEGMNWYFNKKSTYMRFVSISLPAGRFEDLILTPEEQWQRGYEMSRIGQERLVPYHFNYSRYKTLGESYTKDEYMILNKMDRILYTEIFPEIVQFRFYTKDFENLEIDPSIDKLYMSNGLDIWRIHANT